MRTTRTLAAALAITALAVPAAQARPDIHAPLAPAAVSNTRAQDLRHLRAGTANGVAAAGASTPGATYASGATAGGQYTPGATAAGSPPRAIKPVLAVKTPDTASGVSLATIGFGIAAGMLLLASIVSVTRRSRRSRTQRAGIAA